MRFNIFKKENKTVAAIKPTVNHENAPAYTLTPEVELYTAVATAGLSDNFYEKAGNKLERIQSLIAKNNPEFVAKLAVYTRTKMHLRSVPLVLAVELAKTNNGNGLVSKTVNGVVQRADEIAELLAYYQMTNARKGTKKLNRLSKQVQKGLAMSFNKFDEYQFAKYNRAAEVKLRDALFLVHPKAMGEEQQAVFAKIANDTLQTPYTWETELSALGQHTFTSSVVKAAAFKIKWEELIDSNKMGYMATMRNLRNMLEANVSMVHLEKVAAYLSNEKAVANSKQLPFRFLAAYRELKELKHKGVSILLGALEDAVTASAANIAGFDSNTAVVIACDVSSSMQKAVSAKSKIMLYDVGLMLGMLLQSRCKNVVSGMFGDNWKIINMPKRNVLSNVNEYYRREGEVGYATNGFKVIADLIRRNEVVDKVMMFTDVQLWSIGRTGNQLEMHWKEYKKIAPNAKLYLFDLAGYGNTPLSTARHDVHLIAGWSDKIFDLLAAMENGQTAVEVINKMEL